MGQLDIRPELSSRNIPLQKNGFVKAQVYFLQAGVDSLWGFRVDNIYAKDELGWIVQEKIYTGRSMGLRPGAWKNFVGCRKSQSWWVWSAWYNAVFRVLWKKSRKRRKKWLCIYEKALIFQYQSLLFRVLPFFSESLLTCFCCLVEASEIMELNISVQKRHLAPFSLAPFQ